MWSDFQQAVCRVNWGVFADAPRPLSPSEVASFHTIAAVIINSYNPSTLPTTPTAFLSYRPFLAVKDYTSIVCLDMPLAVLQQFSVDTLAQQTQYTGCLTVLKMQGFEARRLSAMDQEVLTMSLVWTADAPDQAFCQLGTMSISPRTVPVACRLTAAGRQPQVLTSFNNIAIEHEVQLSAQVNLLVSQPIALAQPLRFIGCLRAH
ncbi:hypothetical protein V8C86DRAFT_2767878, partial [Haematococcus lacustris]